MLFAERKSDEKYIFEIIEERSYLVSNNPCVGDNCINREYLFFHNDKLVTIIVTQWGNIVDQKIVDKNSDVLFAKLKIETL